MQHLYWINELWWNSYHVKPPACIWWSLHTIGFLFLFLLCICIFWGIAWWPECNPKQSHDLLNGSKVTSVTRVRWQTHLRLICAHTHTHTHTYSKIFPLGLAGSNPDVWSLSSSTDRPSCNRWADCIVSSLVSVAYVLYMTSLQSTVVRLHLTWSTNDIRVCIFSDCYSGFLRTDLRKLFS